MKKIIEISIIVWSFIANSFSFLMGSIDNLLIMLLIIMAIDYLTGICKSIVNKKLRLPAILCRCGRSHGVR